MILFTDSSSGQEGGLNDVAIEVLHQLLLYVVHGPQEQVGLGEDQINAFLDSLRRGETSGQGCSKVG